MKGLDLLENCRAGGEAGPDFRHVRTWIFDLDNTLYRADNGIFAQIEARMTDYVMSFLKLERAQAFVRQKELYRRYGTTLNGLMKEHDAKPDPYLDYVHDIDLSLVPRFGVSRSYWATAGAALCLHEWLP